MVNNHGDRKSPIPGVVGPLPNGHIFMPYKLEVIRSLLTKLRAHPPSNNIQICDMCWWRVASDNTKNDGEI